MTGVVMTNEKSTVAAGVSTGNQLYDSRTFIHLRQWALDNLCEEHDSFVGKK